MEEQSFNFNKKNNLESKNINEVINEEEIKENNNSKKQHLLGLAKVQLYKTYIVSQTNDGIIIVDQHAAHERLVLENIKKQYFKKRVSSQVLLVPEIIEMKEKAEILLENSVQLKKLGLVIESFGEETLIVRETPAILGNLNTKDLLNDLADNIVENGNLDMLDEKIEEVFSTMACHNSVRAGRILRNEEMNAILREMENTPNSGQCNHGRPTFVELKLKDIERLFGRS